MQVKSEGVVLQTAFADEPVTCSLADALLLQLTAKPYISETNEDKDKLFCASGSLHGRVVFGEDQGISSIQWESVGALKPVRLAVNRAPYIERNVKSAIVGSRLPLPYAAAQFRHTLHLKNGEIFPSQIASYDGESITFQSPFITAQRLDSADIKALEFSGRTNAPNTDRTRPKTNLVSFSTLNINQIVKENGVQEVEVRLVGKDGENVRLNLGNMENVNKENPVFIINEIDHDGNPDQEWIEIAPKDGNRIIEQPNNGWVVRDLTTFTLIPEPKKDKSHLKLERALTVPRFNRDNPPSHILVAKTGDMKRGKFLDYQGQTIQFDSKLREFSVPIDRIARVVDVSDFTLPRFQPKSEVRVTLTDGSILIFQPLEVQGGKLLGHSSIYGEVSVPLNSIQYLYFGEKAKSFTAAFEKWIVRPAKEPTYSDSP